MADRSFGPTVLVGLASAGLLALAGSNDWIDTGVRTERVAGQEFVEIDAGIGQVPLAGALGLVLLACWGVLLVARGRWRQVLAWGGLLTSAAALVTWVVALLTLEDQVRESLAAGHGGGGLARPSGELSWTWWTWATVVGIVLSLAATTVATRRARRWPAMGRKYDAPGAGAAVGAPGAAAGTAGTDEVDPTEWWKAIDEGRDPTSDGTP